MTLENQRPLLSGWLTKRFAHGESRENPAERNIGIVRTGFQELLLQARSLAPNDDFTLEQPVDLVTKSSYQVKGTLQYTLEKSIRKYRTYYTANVQICNEKSSTWLSRRTWFLEILEYDDYLARYIDISSDSETRVMWEGNRFGMSLMLLSDDVINHLLTHFTRYNHLRAKATIVDAAHGQFLGFKGRNGWTAHLALTLGYTPAARDEFIKWYR